MQLDLWNGFSARSQTNRAYDTPIEAWAGMISGAVYCEHYTDQLHQVI